MNQETPFTLDELAERHSTAINAIFWIVVTAGVILLIRGSLKP
jgi:hypothetical protein